MMQVANIKLIFLLSLVLLVGCSKKDSSFLLPNGEQLSVFSVNEFSNSYPVVYAQYGGFEGVYGDSLLKEFLLLFEDHSSKVGSDVLGEEKIEKLKEEKISAIRFSVKENDISQLELKTYLLSMYKGCKWVEKEKDIYLIVNKNSENIFCEIKYVNIAIPSFIIKILPN